MVLKSLSKSAPPFFVLLSAFFFFLYLGGHILDAVLFAYYSLLLYLLYVSACLTRSFSDEVGFFTFSTIVLYNLLRIILEPLLILLGLVLYVVSLGFLIPLKAAMLKRGFAMLAFLLGVVGAVDWLLFGPSRLWAVNAVYALLLYACNSARLSYTASLLPISVHLLAPKSDPILEAAALSLPYWAIAALQLTRRTLTTKPAEPTTRT